MLFFGTVTFTEAGKTYAWSSREATPSTTEHPFEATLDGIVIPTHGGAELVAWDAIEGIELAGRPADKRATAELGSLDRHVEGASEGGDARRRLEGDNGRDETIPKTVRRLNEPLAWTHRLSDSERIAASNGAKRHWAYRHCAQVRESTSASESHADEESET